MQNLTLREIQQTELKILLELDNVCRENDIRLYLCGGTMLGAVRHKGFIPWDDDIDVCMPRPDYCRFLKLTENRVFSDNLEVLSFEKGNLNRPFTKIIDKNTRVEYNNNYDLKSAADSVWIDILPVDGLPANYKAAKAEYDMAFFLRRLMMLSYSKFGKGSTFVKTMAKSMLWPIARIVGGKSINNYLVKMAMANPYETSDYVGIVTYGVYGIRERMPKDQFEISTDAEFEGHVFKAMSCWDMYLNNLYGDYMKLPPEDKRKSHQFNAYKVDA